MSVPMPTWSTPATSTSRAIPDTQSRASTNAKPAGHTPITPPTPAMSRACSAEISREYGRSVAVASDQLEAAVGHVYHDAQPIALPDHVRPERAQPAQPGVLGLLVAELARHVVHDLELADAPAIHLP